jgi:ABC-type dipeptide/oligopeptide/nickel transport system permease subunit
MIYYAHGDALISSEDLQDDPSLVEKLSSFYKDLDSGRQPAPLAFESGELTPANALTSFDVAAAGDPPDPIAFTPIGLGKPLTVMIREVYTGKFPKGGFLGGGGKDMPIELAAAAMIVAVAFAVPLGIAAAVWRGTAVDHTATTLSLLGISIPNFWLGPLLAIVFSIELGWLPVSGRGTWSHLVLPAISLGAALAAILARMTRATLLEELREQYVTAARARGASRARAVIRHAFRNSLIPVITLIGLQFGAVLTGAVITETIFAWPGVGRLLILSIGFRDYPLVQGCILLIAVTYVGVNLLTDLLYGLVDPRIRYE